MAKRLKKTPRKKAAARRKTSARGTAKSRKRTPRKRAAAAARSRKSTKPRPPRQKARGPAATAIRGAVAGAVAAVAGRLPWTGAGTDALTLLETDHRRMEDLLKQGEETTERAVQGRSQLLDTLTAELNLHEMIEERILYPALKDHPEAKDIVLEGYQEHHIADVIVRELHQVARDDERWGAKFKVLKENIEHHIEEEEGKMFRTARAVLSREELQKLGARMAAMKTRGA